MKGRPAPNPSLLRRVDALARAATPMALTVALLVLAAMPDGLPGCVAAVALPCVFFWSVFRPAAMPPPVVFGLGLLQDLLSAAPIGTGVLALLIVHGLAMRWRRFLARQSFLAVWMAFCGFAAGAAALVFVLSVLLAWRELPLVPGLVQFGLTAGLYPPLAHVLIRVHEAMRRAESAP